MQLCIRGWAPCDGTLFSISNHEDLFALRAPPLAAMEVVHLLPCLIFEVGSQLELGQEAGLSIIDLGGLGGGETATLTEDNFPTGDIAEAVDEHSHSFTTSNCTTVEYDTLTITEAFLCSNIDRCLDVWKHCPFLLRSARLRGRDSVHFFLGRPQHHRD